MKRIRGGAPALALGSILSVQVGAAASTSLFATVGPAGTAWLRLCWAALFFIVVARPKPWQRSGRDLATAVSLGVVSATMTVCVFEAIARIPLSTAVAIGFLGPLTVAVLRRTSRAGLIWPALALLGVVTLTQPWRGAVNGAGIVFALAAAAGWGGYIELTQRAGDRFEGIEGLAISVPVAALVSTIVGVPQAAGHLSMAVVLECAGLALLLPVLPYALEMFALRRLGSAVFGTLMSVEPAVALIVGLVLLHQVPGPAQILGIALVTAAALGAARTGARDQAPTVEGQTLGVAVTEQPPAEPARAEPAPAD